MALFDTRFQDWDKDYKSGEILKVVFVLLLNLKKRSTGGTCITGTTDTRELKGGIPVGNWTTRIKLLVQITYRNVTNICYALLGKYILICIIKLHF